MIFTATTRRRVAVIVTCVGAATLGTAATGDIPHAASRSRRALAADSTWRDHDAAADSAAARHDWPDYLRHVRVLDSALHHHPGVTLALARGHAQLGDTATAFALLRDFAATGIYRDLRTDSLLAPLHKSESWSALLRMFDANEKPRGSGETLFTLPDTGFAAEDIAYDARRRRYYLSSIRRHAVAIVDASGHTRQLVGSSPESPLWAVLALGIDTTRQRLWVTTVGNDRIPGLAPGERPHASILRVDLNTARLLRRFDLPDDGVPREPGDLVVASNGDVFVSDGRTGAVYAIEQRADSVRVLVPPGELVAPQEPVMGADGRTVLVPDYVRGIAAVDRTNGHVQWLSHQRTIVVNGIDGLVWASPRSLIAVQNGVTPPRIVRLTLNERATAVTASEVIAQGGMFSDPTHGVIVGDHYDVIAYSGGAALALDGSLRPGARLLPSTVARMRLK
jgi:hypothetical protein